MKNTLIWIVASGIAITSYGIAMHYLREPGPRADVWVVCCFLAIGASITGARLLTHREP